jgi:hypothetical protein
VYNIVRKAFSGADIDNTVLNSTFHLHCCNGVLTDMTTVTIDAMAGDDVAIQGKPFDSRRDNTTPQYGRTCRQNA